MNQQLFPASFRSKPFSLSTTETCLSLLRDPASCKNGWQSRRLSSAAGHGSLFNVQSKQMTISHTQFLSYDDSSNCCAFVTCAWNHWPHTHCRHVIKKKHSVYLWPAAQYRTINISVHYEVPFPPRLGAMQSQRLSQWQAISALGPKLWSLSTPADSSMQQFQTSDFEAARKYSAMRTKSKRNTTFLRWVKCTKCTQWCDDFSYDYRPRQRYTKNVRLHPSQEWTTDNSAPLLKQWACGFVLQTAKNFDVGEQVSQTWCFVDTSHSSALPTCEGGENA